MMKPTLSLLLPVLLLAACAYHPVIDPKTSAHPENFQADLTECRQIAEQAPRGKALAGAEAAATPFSTSLKGQHEC